MVLGYHFGVRGAANGFMGVDIFFVVSGFLMQKLYRPEQGAVDFWTRRARRLLPAYFTTLAATLSVGAVILLPDAFAQLRDQTAVAAVFGSNIGFWWAESYFQPKQFAPLLHLWSLGVELQYYLIVPLLVRILARFPRLLALLIIPLFLFCLAVVTVSPKTAFFMLPPRLWEFLLGAIVASWRGDTSLLPGWVSPVALLALIPMLVWPVDGTLTSILHGHPAIPVALVCLLTAIALAGTVEDRWLDNWPGRIAIGL
ncbi:MAG: acyltransferase, partial [Sphingomicrobium sp.]